MTWPTRNGPSCPTCRQRVLKSRGRALTCPDCQFSGHRNLVAATGIATRTRAADHHPRTCRGAWGGHAPSSRPAPPRRRPVPTCPPAAHPGDERIRMAAYRG